LLLRAQHSNLPQRGFACLHCFGQDLAACHLRDKPTLTGDEKKFVNKTLNDCWDCQDIAFR
jgi:hypothetical protein